MKYDLHVHTTCSDGKYDRLELLKKADDLDFHYLCFADHNYIANDINKLVFDFKSKYDYTSSVKLFLSTELDIEEYPNLHILGYDMKDISNLEQELKQIEFENTEICKELIKKIYYQYGIVIPVEDLENMTINGNITKNIVVQWLIDNKYAKNVYEAGMKFTSKYSPCYVKRSNLKLEQAFSLVKDSGGFLVMAHPSSLKLSNDELYKFVKKLKEKGLDGIEVFNADKTSFSQLRYYCELAKTFDLFQTSGSDFHRETKTSIFGVDNTYSDSFVKMLEKRR